MRTENSFKNSIVAVLSNVLVLVLGFAIQTVFVKTLGEEYLGVNGLFSNVLSMLAIVEFGIGPAIVSNLYKPLAENDYGKIKSLMGYYRNAYHLIGVVVFAIGMLIMPFIRYFVKTEIVFPNPGGLYSIFFLFIVDAMLSYFCSYKRSIIQADQKNRVINLVHLICYTVMIVLQGLILILTGDYILFLLIKIGCRFLENVILSLIADKVYPYLRGKAPAIQKEDKENIFTKVKGLIYHKIGGYMVMGTDNIIISAFLGVGLVGLYSNYYLIINSLYLLYCQIFASLTASVGNLIATESKENNYAVYKRIMFLNFWIYGFSAAALFTMMTPFVTVWLGEEFLLSDSVLAVLTLNFYMLGMRSSIGTFKDAAGIFYEDRFIPILESLINLVTSLVLVQYFGLTGVFLGTFLSSLIVVFYSLPQFVFPKVFGRGKRDYYLLYLRYLLLALVATVLTVGAYRGICSVLTASNFVMLAIATALSAIVPNGLFFLLFRKTDEFGWFRNFAANILNRKKDT